MELSDMIKTGLGIAQDKLREIGEMHDKFGEEATRLDDKTLVRRWKSCSNSLKKTVLINEMKNRGFTQEDFKKYL
jgi:hypothetical protein